MNTDDKPDSNPEQNSNPNDPEHGTVPPTIRGPSPLHPFTGHPNPSTPSGAPPRPRFSRSGSGRTPLPLERSDLSSESVLRDVPRGAWEGEDCPALGGIPLLTKLGEGGMGSVFLGIHPRLSSAVAVKVLPVHLADQDPRLIARFIREAQIAARVHSPHLIHVIDVNYDAGLYYLVMEYVHGTTAGKLLTELRNSSRKLSQLDAVDICIGAATGLLVAHDENIIHRDIKPDNIMIPRSPVHHELECRNAKLMDLGLARVPSGAENNAGLTLTQTSLGTPGFMPPEQILDARTADTRADIFSIGATLYALVAGRAPFLRESAMKSLYATLNEPHTPLREHRADAIGPLVAIVNRCMAKDREERYADTRSLIEDLHACRKIAQQKAGETASAPPVVVIPPRTSPAATRQLKKRRMPAARTLAGFAAMLLVAAAAGFLAWTYGRTARNETQRVSVVPAVHEEIRPRDPADTASTEQQHREESERLMATQSAKLEQLRREEAERQANAADAAKLEQQRPDETERQAKVAEAAKVEQQRREESARQVKAAEAAKLEQQRHEETERPVKAAEAAKLEQQRRDEAAQQAKVAEAAKLEQQRHEEAQRQTKAAEAAKLEQQRRDEAERQAKAAEAKLEQQRREDAERQAKAVETAKIEQQRRDEVERQAKMAEAAKLEQMRRNKFERHVKAAEVELNHGNDLELVEREIVEAAKLFPKDPQLVALRRRLSRRQEELILANQRAASEQAQREREVRYDKAPPPEPPTVRERPQREYRHVGEHRVDED